MSKYEINKNTLAVVGINDFKAMAIESDNNYIINDNSYQIMEDSCNYFGSTFKGRVDGTKKMMNINYKVPIIIEESNDIIFFPLSEIDSSNCVWISLKWFDRVVKENNNTYIYFKNGEKISINVSKYVVENQFFRSLKLSSILNDRKNLKNI